MPYIGKSPGNGVRQRYIYAATAGQTSFSGNDSAGISLAYDDPSYLDVYQNGVLLKPVTDYASTTGTSVVLVTGATTDDVIEMITYDTFAIADTVSAKDGGSFAGAVSMASTLGVTGAVTTSSTASIAGHASVGVAAVDSTRALTVAGATDGTGSSIIVGYNSSLASKFSVRDDGFVSVGNGLSLADGNLTVASGHGINFAATADGSGTTGSELFDDYEEGTFSPTFQQGMSVSSYSAQNGKYTKVGNLVTAQIDLDINSGSANSSHVYIGGLPFTSFDGAPYGGGFISYNGGWHNALVSFLVIANATYLALYAQADGGVIAGNALSDFDATIRITAIYIAA